MKYQPLEPRFWTRVQKKGPSDCWLWTGAADPRGYGFIRHNGRQTSAHRASYQIHNGPIPNGMVICHSCDTPACVNPAHLFLGTQADNVRDCATKGRRVDNSGAHCGTSKLTESEVAAIRADQRLQREIAAAYGISRTAVSYIKNRITWRKAAASCV